MSLLAGLEGFLSKIPNVLKVGGSLLANGLNQAGKQSVSGNMEQQIKTGLKYGIHPLESIGGNISSAPAIPLQNPFAGIQPAEKVDAVTEETKREVLAKLKREAKDSKWDYSLLIPVTHPQYPGQKFWGFNPRYQMFGSVAQSIVLAANAEKAWMMMESQMSDEDKKKAKAFKKKLYQMEANPGGPSP